MYFDYIKELYNRDSIVDEFGFLTYSFHYDSHGAKYLEIFDLYVKPQYRTPNAIVAKGYYRLVIEEAKLHNCKYVLINIEVGLEDTTKRVKWYLRNGFDIVNASNEVVLMGKGL